VVGDMHVTTKEIPKRELRIHIHNLDILDHSGHVTTKEIPKRELRTYKP
jgi:hypothetical protein